MPVPAHRSNSLLSAQQALALPVSPPRWERPVARDDIIAIPAVDASAKTRTSR